MWLKCILWGTIPSYAVSVVWERQEPLSLNKWFNCNQELFLMFSLPSWIRYICSNVFNIARKGAIFKDEADVYGIIYVWCAQFIEW